MNWTAHETHICKSSDFFSGTSDATNYGLHLFAIDRLGVTVCTHYTYPNIKVYKIIKVDHLILLYSHFSHDIY